MTAWSVVEAELPASIEDPAAGAVRGAHRLNAETQRRTWGHEDFVEPPQHWLGTLRSQEYTDRVVLVAVVPGTTPVRPGDVAAHDVVGAAVLELPRTSNHHLAELDVWADPDRLHRGVGSALVDAAERVAAERGRTTVQGMTYHRGEPPEGHPDALTATSGSGRLDASVPGVRFAAGRGYTPEQAERYSVLDVPLDDAALARHLDGAAAAAGPAYRLHSWTDRTPDAWLDDVGVLLTRMSTDVPLAGLDVEEDPWDAERVRYGEDVAAASGRGYVVTVAEHVPSGRLVALTRIEHPVAQPECAWQEDTLVLREHRGHRLGMLVKAANLRHLARERPATRRVHTWNAEENGHMLAINVALGFRPAGVYASWQRRL
ncbi:N-acetyltransferase family protein [Cellulomonas sp. 179-A 4D5 NHS]|uniref:GNAT family N-acetyltransferase n=1 Tax=Cellulomonas sp. 179-A 4D5 NHS TaxID=3142378 RepID=UPI00399F2961